MAPTVLKSASYGYAEPPEKSEPTERPTPVEPTTERKSFPLNKVVALLIIALIIGLLVLYSPQFLSSNPHSTVSPSPSTTTLVSPNPSTSTVPSVPSTAPSTMLPQTSSQEDLACYALSLINQDRQSQGLQNVTLSSVDSGQLHADDMLRNGYLSHWDLNGYKPYMRYTLAGGQGAVGENCAWEGQTGGTVSMDVEATLKDLEWGMMYNDSASNWGHRDDILDPLHNKVSIGIAYDSNNVYFVEDFENDYVSWSQLSLSNNQVTMAGTLEGQESTSQIQQVAVFYDNPSPLTVDQLNSPPYQDGYDPGTYGAIVVPPAPPGHYYSFTGISQQGIVADSWNQNGNSFQIGFSLSQAEAVYGKGVYTLYLLIGNSTADSLTTYSIWIS
jgi:uncharacterized protein YkwD